MLESQSRSEELLERSRDVSYAQWRRYLAVGLMGGDARD